MSPTNRLGFALIGVAFVASCGSDPNPQDRAETSFVSLDPALIARNGLASWGDVRHVTVDLEPWGESGVANLVYDVNKATQTLSAHELTTAEDWVIATRLLLGEVGAGRLAEGQWTLLEAVAILQTVRNRMDPAIWNPERVDGVRAWPGCGDSATFGSCANAEQYQGLRGARARRPNTTVRDRNVLLAGLDRAVAAWWLVGRHHLADVTGGATSFAHRCGGSVYGGLRSACDGVDDSEGADPSAGPLVLLGPSHFRESKHRYDMTRTLVIDHVPGALPQQPGVYWRYLEAQRADMAERSTMFHRDFRVAPVRDHADTSERAE